MMGEANVEPTQRVQRSRDPMVYDVMRETANLLRGSYVARESAATDPAEQRRWFELDVALMDEVAAVDPWDEDLVRAKTAEFVERRRRLIA